MDKNTEMAARGEQLLAGWDALGVHRTGTQEDAATARWLADQVRAFGAAPHIVSFPFRRRVPSAARLVFGDSDIVGVPAFDGGSTPREGVLARLSPVAGGGGIGVAVVSPNLNTEGSRALVAARRQDQHAGLVAITDPIAFGPGVAPFNADHWTQPFGPPLLQVGAEHAEKVLAAANAGVEARLFIVDDWAQTEASNVEAVVAGRDAAAPPLVVMTPRSGWWTCTSERGGGLILWLEALRALAAAPPPRRRVIFTANTGHELGHVGLDAFLAARPELTRGAAAWLHLGANFVARGSRLRLQTSDAELRASVQACLQAESVHVDEETLPGARPFGEARNVFDGGGRYVSLLGSNPLFHHPDDRWPHAVDVPALMPLARAFVDLVRQLAQ